MQCYLGDNAAIGQCINCGKPVCKTHSRETGDGLFCTECAVTHICLEADHDWDEWHYTAANLCNQIRTCRKCGTVSEKMQHNWITTNHRTEDVCMHFVCSRCREQRIREHDFHVHGPRSEAYVCVACGYVRRRMRVA